MSERAFRRDDDRAGEPRPPEPAAQGQSGLLGLASGMGNAAFTEVAWQWIEDDAVSFPPDRITATPPSSDTIVMPQEQITATPPAEPTIEGDLISFPPDEIRL